MVITTNIDYAHDVLLAAAITDCPQDTSYHRLTCLSRYVNPASFLAVIVVHSPSPTNRLTLHVIHTTLTLTDTPPHFPSTCLPQFPDDAC